ncbi:MAG: hypothetical protein IT581_16365 [Verrucomicrobiales bacterium]|nr:hypothetical protein [Verrucomicrobiales bacterium]
MNDADKTLMLQEVEGMIRRLRVDDDMVRGPAFQGAGPLGALAVRPLVGEMGATPPETARAARRALWNVVRYAGQPGGGVQASAVVGEIRAVFGNQSESIQRELLWMVSELGDKSIVPWLAELLDVANLREDARCALMRTPGARATSALRAALSKTEGVFASDLADALRARGESITDPPSRSRTPDRQTSVGK